MNVLLKLRKDMAITGLVPFKYLLYTALLTNVVSYEPKDEDVKYGIYGGEQEDLYDRFPDWSTPDERTDEVYKALNELSDEGLIFFDEDDRIYLGEFRGKKFFGFDVKNSLFDEASKLLDKELKRYSSSRSAKDKSRSRYIRERIAKFLDKGVENMSPGDFTELHGYLYEIYTGGELYVIRNKTEYYQTNNMLKAYDKFTVYALLVEGTLNYDNYRKRGIPTLTTVACMKDDVFHTLSKPAEGSKDYMREISSSIDENSEF